MKNYTITVNGNVYEVTVEEGASTGAAPKAAPAVKAAPAPAAPKAAAAGAGKVKVTAGAAGKVTKIVKNVGDAVKKGENVIMIESMKMEIGQVAVEDGTVAS
ncbi:MAG: acetyl-CoA carboxylase biotin carboxyl carrier protein subunit, partial [Lachnospiraceae bacterium]|nr:acetyl-CoA carboxylase biotin carboxyl carrier protein subunit [Lachnospiraceae bacterium]